MTAWLDDATPWMVAVTLAAVLALVLTALMYRNERRKRPHGMRGRWVKRYKGKNIYSRHLYDKYPDYTGADPTGSTDFYVEHGSRSYPTLDAAREAILDGSWSERRALTES